MEKLMDIVGGILWVLMFTAPLIIMPCIWKFIDGSKMIRIVMGLILSLVCSYLLYGISLAIIFRHGMGP